jgi:plastocyanin
MISRRHFMRSSGLAIAVCAAPRIVRAAGVVEIEMRSSPRGEDAWFDPLGVRIDPGQRVRWIMTSPGNPHTTTAYHPKNARHSLRIPEAAVPWDSGFLVNARDIFEIALTVEGVYDYFCLPHEAAGMVGRIVVGRPGGPGAMPFDYFTGRPATEKWLPVPEAAQTAFPAVTSIVAERVVRRR